MLGTGHYKTQRLISEIGQSIVTIFCHMFDGDSFTQIYKIVSEIWGPSPKNFDGPMMSKFGPDFRQLYNLVTNISGMEQDIVKSKTALQTAISPADTQTHT